MHRSPSLLLAASLLSHSVLAGAPPRTPANPLAAAAARAVDPGTSATAREAAVRELRAARQRGVDAVLAAGGSGPVLDAVCGQFDCASSRLFWHTDLEEAKAIAALESKPILSLRLLGRLDEELSCANSRFFRATLYPDAAIARLLREGWVLHWESVRPVPKVRIDFGDGRVLERTLTGNSIHYVLDAKGRPVDGIPGLLGPRAFRAQLERDAALARAVAPLDADARARVLREHHGARVEALLAAWTKDLAKAGVAAPAAKGAAPDTRQAELERASADRWDALAALHGEDARLDEAARTASRKLLPPTAWEAGRLAVTKAVVEDPMLRQFAVLERSLALDGVRNEYLLHAKIHRWFARGSAPDDLVLLNERVYQHLFLMPLSDPWLGLSPDGAFSAITADGRRVNR